jgi:hypothetical protein
MPFFLSPKKSPDTSIILERIRIMDDFKSTVSNADNRVIENFQVINNQIHRTLKASIYFNVLMFISAFLFIGASFYIFLYLPGSSQYQHYFSVIALIGGVFILFMLFVRNPVFGFQQFIGNYMKVNMVFINYIRQVNLLDAAIRQVFIESPDETLEATQATIQQFQDLLETSIDRANNLLEEL